MKNIVNILVSGLIVFVLASCGRDLSIVNDLYEDDLGATIWSTSDDDEDNVVIVMYPNVMVDEEGDIADLKLGMIWTQSSPDGILLILARDTDAPPGGVSPDYLSVDIDGRTTRFELSANEADFQGHNDVSRDAYRQGRASVRVPVDYIGEMIEGSDVRVAAPGFDVGLFHHEALRVMDDSYILLAKRTFKEAIWEVSRETGTPPGFQLDHFEPMSSD